MAQKMALKLADYVVNETGFAADLGVEKYCDIVMPASGLKPAAAVLVVTIRALLAQGNTADNRTQALTQGFANLAKHWENLQKFNLPTIVAINRFYGDKEEEIKLTTDYCQQLGVESAVIDVFAQGGAGAITLAEKVIALTEKTDANTAKSLYSPHLSIAEKIETIAKQIYGASAIAIETLAEKRLKKIAALGYSHLPICMAKTPNSFSDNPKLLGAPRNWTLTVTDAHLSAGAGFIVPLAGNVLLMPGLSQNPRATRMQVDESGKVSIKDEQI